MATTSTTGSGPSSSSSSAPAQQPRMRIQKSMIQPIEIIYNFLKSVSIIWRDRSTYVYS